MNLRMDHLPLSSSGNASRASAYNSFETQDGSPRPTSHPGFLHFPAVFAMSPRRWGRRTGGFSRLPCWPPDHRVRDESVCEYFPLDTGWKAPAVRTKQRGPQR